MIYDIYDMNMCRLLKSRKQRRCDKKKINTSDGVRLFRKCICTKNTAIDVEKLKI